MNSYRQNNGARKRLFYATLLLLFVFLLDAFTGGKIRTLVRSGASVLYGVVGRIGAPIAESGFFSSRRALEAENESLKQQLAGLEARAADYQALKDENAVLRGLTHLPLVAQGITAPVISSFRSSLYGTFVIGAGQSDGIVKDSLVFTADPSGAALVLGRVSEASAHTSLVMQIFAPDISTDALIHGVGVVVKGSGGGNATAEAPRNAPIVAGDPVVAPALGQRVIGVVGAVTGDSTSASRKIYIALPISLAALQFVYVVPAQK